MTATTDWCIDLNHPENSLAYPGGVPVEKNSDALAPVLAIAAAMRSSEVLEKSLCVNGVTYRCRLLATLDGPMVMARVCGDSHADLYALGLPGGVLGDLLDARLNAGGLIVVAGRPGQGKSTTCTALITQRLALFGGVCLTVEDPVERRIQGAHGKGLCLQMGVATDAEYHDAIKGSLRGYPSGESCLLYLGEIRDGLAASQVLKASVDGRLVLTTVHADDPVSAVARILALAQSVLGDAGAREFMASGLRMVVHQTLKDAGFSAKSMNLSVLANTSSGVAGAIRSGNLPHLLNEAATQKVRMENGASLFA